MLYIHIPYCHHKCTYCAFYSVARGRNVEEYVEALCVELALRRTDRPLRTVYFGGGTPTVLTIRQLERIVDTIRANYDLSQLEEATIEANPENLTPQYLEGLASMRFFNRLSIGIQSFDDGELKMLNRVHDSRQACDAIRNAAAAGFDNLSVDLMMGLPRPHSVGLQHSLECLSSLLPLGAVKHLSCYELTVEQGTMLDRQLKTGRLSMPEDDEVTEQYAALQEWCRANGFEQYEVSNFCRPGWHSRHNSRYWNRTPYTGIGAAAHSFDGRCRRWNVADIARYIDGANAGEIPFEEETLTQADACNEYIMTALRTARGIDKQMLASLAPQGSEAALSKGLARFVGAGLLLESDTHYTPSPEGLLQADGIAASLFV